MLEPLAEEAAHERFAQIADYYEARREPLDKSGAPYKPLPPDRLYLSEKEWKKRLDDVPLAQVTPFAVPEGGQAAIDIGTRQGHNFTAERAEPNANVFDALTRHVHALQAREQARGRSRCGAKARANA